MYLLKMLHRMLTQIIKFGLLLKMFCGNTLLNLLQPFTVNVVAVRIGGSEDYNWLREVRYVIRSPQE